MNGQPEVRELPACGQCGTLHPPSVTCLRPTRWAVPGDVLTMHPRLRTPDNWERYAPDDGRRLGTRQTDTARRLVAEALA